MRKICSLFDEAKKKRPFFFERLAKNKRMNRHGLASSEWLTQGPLAIPGVTDIVTDYSQHLEGRCTMTLKGHTRSVNALAALPNGHLASASSDRTVRVWDTTHGVCVRTMVGHSKMVNDVVVLRDGHLASGSQDNTIRVWNSSNGACIRVIDTHTEMVFALLVLPNGHLASGSVCGLVKIWNVETGVCQATFDSDAAVYRLALMPSGILIICALEGRVFLCDPLKLQLLRTLYKQTNDVVVLPDGEFAMTLVDDHHIYISDGAQGTAPSEPFGQKLFGHTDEVNAMAVLPDGELVSCSDDATVRVWSGRACRLTLTGHDKDVNALCVLSDGRLASASDDHTVRVWS
jgi:WD40 repeat protein